MVQDERISKYVELFTSQKSPLWDITDYESRKKEALKQAGFKKSDELYGLILEDADQSVIELEIDYAIRNGGNDMAMYISLTKYFREACERIAKPIGEITPDEESKSLAEDKELKCYELKGKIREELQKTSRQLEELEEKLFKKDVKQKKKVAERIEDFSAEHYLSEANHK